MYLLNDTTAKAISKLDEYTTVLFQCDILTSFPEVNHDKKLLSLLEKTKSIYEQELLKLFISSDFDEEGFINTIASYSVERAKQAAEHLSTIRNKGSKSTEVKDSGSKPTKVKTVAKFVLAGVVGYAIGRLVSVIAN